MRYKEESNRAMEKQRTSIRLFKNDILERFTHVHPITPLILWVPIVAWLIWRSVFVHSLSVWKIAGMGAIAVIVWTLTEYVLHRYVFHFKARGAFQERINFLIHGIHHDDPSDATRLVMPPVAGLILATILYLFFRLITGPVLIDPFFAFFLMGYLWYDYTHYYVHHFNPKTSFGKMVKKHHMLHHYATPEAKWGVSTPFWDYVFRTMKSEDDIRQKRERRLV